MEKISTQAVIEKTKKLVERNEADDAILNLLELLNESFVKRYPSSHFDLPSTKSKKKTAVLIVGGWIRDKVKN